MKELSMKLSSISKTDDEALLEEAKRVIRKLRKINLRWNIAGLTEFLKERRRELFPRS